jgi:hypothetical protein
VPALLRPPLPEPARGQEGSGPKESAEDTAAFGREREHARAFFPKRPKGMNLDTYMRLFWEHHEAQIEQLAGMRAWLDELEKRVG